MNLSKEKSRSYIWINKNTMGEKRDDATLVFNYPVKLIARTEKMHEIYTRSGEIITVDNWDICRIVYREEGDEPIEDKKVPEKLIVSP